MDCPSEERIIRMKLEKFSGIKIVQFAIPERKVTIFHLEDPQAILESLHELNLDSTIISSEDEVSLTDSITIADSSSKERKTLFIVLFINLLFFIFELFTGYVSYSLGLTADSLDMLADSNVYGLALFAAGRRPVFFKKLATRFAGIVQFILAVIGLIEVIRRFTGFEHNPDFIMMMGVSFLAMIANAICLVLLTKNASSESHMQASVIFTSNDILINGAVIVSGFFVWLIKSQYPDLIVGAIVFIIVARGAWRILKLA